LSANAIEALVRERASSELWVQGSTTRSWHDFGNAVAAIRGECVRRGVAAGSVVVTPGDASFDSLAWLFGAASICAVVAPLRLERMAECEAWKDIIKVGWRVNDGALSRVEDGADSPSAARLLGELRGREHAGLILATGGTTGAAKLVLHDLTALLASVPIKEGQAWRTMPLMRFDHIGGLDAALRALAGRQVLVEPPAEITPELVAASIERQRVQVLPATPSFLNLLLLSGAEKEHDLSSLRVVPYGAEPMPRALLSRLKSALPHAKFIERFGTSETGALPVRDAGGGLALVDDADGYSWRIVDGELWVKSPVRALGYLGGNATGLDGPGWFKTGDIAEQGADGEIRILGRREDVINIGGEKVLPAEVEGVLLSHPLVADCRVTSEANAVLGQLVVADIVWSGPERDAVTVKRMLHEFARGLIARHKLPARIRLVTAVDSSRNLKKLRNFRS
jgi:acyl-CoA synthetase (AMP-forming)/AMP-acid ligase II